MEIESHMSLQGGKRRKAGFTIFEMLVSVMILALIATATVLDLRTMRAKDELQLAARLIVADLRGLQNQALTAQNVKLCPNVNGKQVICETSTVACVSSSSCIAQPPLGVGFHSASGSAAYDFFADVDPSPAQNDWLETDSSEVLQTRDLAGLGAPNVVIDGFLTTINLPTLDIAFQRQSGVLGINGCFFPCVTPSSVRIRLRHTKISDTKTILIQSATGRISIE